MGRTDNGVWSGNQSQTGRTGSALSYSASSGPVSFQIDANMNGNTGRSVDMAQLGMSFDTGAAKVGLAVITAESAKDSTRQSSIGVSVPVGGLTLYSSWSEKEVTTFATPGSEAVVIPGIKDFEVPGSPTFTVPGRPEVMARAATPDRCLIVRYAGATFGQEPVLHPTSNEPLFWIPALPEGQTMRPEWNEEDHLGMTTTNSAIGAGDPVMRDSTNVVIRDPNRTDDSDISLMRFREATATVSPPSDFNPETGVFDDPGGVVTHNCGVTTAVVPTDEDRLPFIVERRFEPAVPAVDAVAAGAPLAVVPAQAEINIPAQTAVTNPAQTAINIAERSEITVPGSPLVTIPATDPQDISGTVQVVLTPAVDPTPETKVKTRHMHAGVSGSLGDTGMSFAINVANHPDSSDGENPWNFNVSKSLGGGASLAFEYIDNDSMETSNEALVQLRVDF